MTEPSNIIPPPGPPAWRDGIGPEEARHRNRRADLFFGSVAAFIFLIFFGSIAIGAIWPEMWPILFPPNTPRC